MSFGEGPLRRVTSHVTPEDLLGEIAAYCKQHRVAETAFGRRALNDAKLVSRLRRNQQVTLRTVHRVRSFISLQLPVALDVSGSSITRRQAPTAS
jgi:hypothetical protein